MQLSPLDSPRFQLCCHTSTSVDEPLASVLAVLNLGVINAAKPTRYDRRRNINNLLNLLIEPLSDQLLTSVTTTPLAALFDHHLVKAQLRVKRRFQ
jgi:hypothetical protein